MKTVVPFSLAIIATIGVSCVSQKKYQSAVSELEQIKAKSAVESAVASTDQPKDASQASEQVRQLEMQMQEMGMELQRLQARIEDENIPELSPEQQMQLQEEQARAFELKMIEMQDKMAKDEARTEANQTKGLLMRVEAASEAAFKTDASSDVAITTSVSTVTISITSEALFGTGQVLNTNGKTLVEKLRPVIEQHGSLSVKVLSVAKSSESADFKKAYTIHEVLSEENAYRKANPIAGIVGCDYAKVELDKCDRVDIVFYSLNEPLVNLMSRTNP